MLTELSRLRREFASLPDAFSRFTYLIELSALLDTGAGDLHAPANRYAGCQSAVWLLPAVEAGAVRLYADSDSALIKGVLYLYAAVLAGECPEAAAAADFDLTAELGLSEHFDAERALGVRGLLSEIQRRLAAGQEAGI